MQIIKKLQPAPASVLDSSTGLFLSYNPTEGDLAVNESLEASVLGTLLAAPTAWSAVQSIIGPGMFAGAVGREVAPALWDHIAQVGPDRVSLPIFCSTYQIPTQVVSDLVLRCDLSMLEDAAALLAEQHFNRSFRSLLVRGVAEWEKFDGWQDVFRWLDESRRDLLSYASPVESMADAISGYVARLRAGMEGGVVCTGVTSGFEVIDEHTGGYQPGDQIVVGARPGMGKTRFALVGCLQAAMQGKRVKFFSKELTRDQIIATALSYFSGVPVGALRTPDKLHPDDLALVEKAAAKLEALPFTVEDRIPNSEFILSKCREAKYSEGLDMFVVDYVQLLYSARTQKNETRTNELARISASFKSLDKDLNCVSVILSQLGRQVDSRADKRPNDGDLRDSGSLEADADMTLFLYNPTHYYPNSEEPYEVILSKARFGTSKIFEMELSATGFIMTEAEKEQEAAYWRALSQSREAQLPQPQPNPSEFVPNPGSREAVLVKYPAQFNDDDEVPF